MAAAWTRDCSLLCLDLKRINTFGAVVSLDRARSVQTLSTHLWLKRVRQDVLCNSDKDQVAQLIGGINRRL